MRPHGGVARLHMGRQRHGDGRSLSAVFAASLQCEAHGIWVWHIAIERHQDGGLQLGSPVALQQPHQSGRDGAEIGAARGGANQQSLAGGSRVGEMIGSAVVVRLALLLDQGLNMGGILDPIAPSGASRRTSMWISSTNGARKSSSGCLKPTACIVRP